MKTLHFLATLLCLHGLVDAAYAEDKPDLVLRGSISGRDNHTYKLVPFDVPAGIDRITVEFDYSGKDEKTAIDLGLTGPGGLRDGDGLRGWSGGNKRLFTISTSDATPSYLPTDIRPGCWNLLLGIPNIREKSKSEFTANVYFSRNGHIPGLLDVPLRKEPGWYRGDLHMHDAHSDGSCVSQSGAARVPCPLFLTVQAAAGRHLDFIAITDHNTTSHANAIRELQPYFDRLLLIPGREITTFGGHANLFGTTAPLDFRIGSVEVPDMNTLLKRVATLGGVLSINHPVRPSGEACMGCGWQQSPDFSHIQAVEVVNNIESWLKYAQLQGFDVQAIEAVNGTDAGTPISGIPFWQAALDHGFRPAAIGGSDNHDAKIEGDGIGKSLIGVPTTVVHADNLSQRAILAGILAGHVFIDIAGTNDRLLEFSTRVRGRAANMGDDVVASDGEQLDFGVHVAHITGGVVEALVDGKPITLGDPNVVVDDQMLRFAWRSDGARHELHVQVRDDADKLALLGNPIYLNRVGSTHTR